VKSDLGEGIAICLQEQRPEFGLLHTDKKKKPSGFTVILLFLNIPNINFKILPE